MRWFTSDLHFGHSNIIKHARRDRFLSREEFLALKEKDFQWEDKDPYKISKESTDNMDEEIIHNINNLVSSDDILYFLGDFCRPGLSTKEAKKYRERIRCKTMHFVRGNHDKPGYDSIFSTADDVLVHELPQGMFFLSHYPHATWHRSHRGSFHLYGHEHATFEDKMNHLFPKRRSMDVGVDNAAILLGAYRPFSVEEVVSILLQRSAGAIYKTSKTEEEILGDG